MSTAVRARTAALAKTPARTERRIVAIRFSRRWGAHRIAYHLGLAQSTVSKLLARYRMPLLAHLDRATGLAIRRPTPARYERQLPGELVHLDVKKLGRIPDGGGHQVLGRAEGVKVKGGGRPGYAYAHAAIDDHSRLVYSDILGDERKQTTAMFYLRTRAYYRSMGITVHAVITDRRRELPV